MAAIACSASLAVTAPRARPQFRSKALPLAASTSSVRARSVCHVVFASDKEEFETLESTAAAARTTTIDRAAPGLQEGIQSVSDFTGLGFTGEDSAGQSNIFSVEPKMYVADENDSSEEVNSLNLIAGGIAATLLLVGFGVLSQTSAPAPVGFDATGESLTVIYERLAGVSAPWM